MTDRDRPSRHDELVERIGYIERTLARLGEELVVVRALASAEGVTREPEAVIPAAPAPAMQQPPAVRDVLSLPTKPSALEPATPLPAAAAAVAPTAPEWRPRAPKRPPKPPRRSFGDLAREWDLIGARGFAIAGGAVMALGIGLFFVLAANRGWIDERARVALGATASVLVFAAGLLLRARFGQYWSALAAVGAGIAGAYATLAAAAARYDLVPDVLALPLAGVIAAVGTIVAVRWRSQVIAAIGLLGAALAPALQALDSEMTWESAAFAVIVLIAAGAVTVPRGWRELLISATVIVGAQIEWLAADAIPPVGAGTVLVAAAFVLVLLGVAVGRQIVAKHTDVDPLALGYALAALGVSLVLAWQLFEERIDRGTALLVAAAAWALVCAALQWRRLPDLGLAVGVSALALAAVGTADLVSDAALTIAWAAEAVVLATLARHRGDARLQALGIGYAVLASISALLTEAQPRFLFDETADQLAGALPLGAAAIATIGAGVLVPKAYRERTETGLLAFVGDLRRSLSERRGGVRETLVFVGAALGTVAVSFLLISISFEWGHVAASAVAAAVGAMFVGAAGRLRSDELAVASFVWLGVVLLEALGFDGDAFATDMGADEWASSGGWSIIAASAGVLGGAYVFRIFQVDRRALDVPCGIAIGIAFVASWIGVVWLNSDETRIGIALLAVATVYTGLSAGVFRHAGLRTLSTILWSPALVALVGGELALVDDGVARIVALAATGLVVGLLSAPLGESRLWLAGVVLAIVTSASAFVFIQPWLGDGDLERRLAIASGACMVAGFGLAALVWRELRWRDLNTVVWAVGVLALLVTERVLLDDWRLTAFAAAVTGAVLAVLASPLQESRLWLAGTAVVGVTTVATVAALTPPSHLLDASDAPADGLWVLVGCVLALCVVAYAAHREAEQDVPFLEEAAPRYGLPIVVIAGGLALYAVSLLILEIAERVSTASIETDFERGHTAVSALWALVGLGLLVLGLLRGSPAIRYGGLALFGLSLAKIFSYDLAELSSVARAFSFILVGGLLLTGGFFLQRLSDRIGPRPES